MARRQLNFRTGPLLGALAVTAGASLVMVHIGLNVGERDRLPGLLRLVGRDGAPSFCFLLAAICGWTALAALRRLLGDRTAAAIRADGILIAGMFLTRFIAWHDVAGVRIKHDGGLKNFFLKVDCRGRPSGANPLHHFLAERGYGTAVSFLDADVGEACDWVEAARAAREEGLRPRVRTAVQPAAARPAGGFGRRIV